MGKNYGFVQVDRKNHKIIAKLTKNSKNAWLFKSFLLPPPFSTNQIRTNIWKKYELFPRNSKQLSSSNLTLDQKNLSHLRNSIFEVFGKNSLHQSFFNICRNCLTYLKYLRAVPVPSNFYCYISFKPSKDFI